MHHELGQIIERLSTSNGKAGDTDQINDPNLLVSAGSADNLRLCSHYIYGLCLMYCLHCLHLMDA